MKILDNKKHLNKISDNVLLLCRN